MIAGGHGEENPNKSYLGSKGIWITYTLVVLFVHIILLAVPIINISFAWTITNVLHNMVIVWLSCFLYLILLISGSNLFPSHNQRVSVVLNRKQFNFSLDTLGTNR